MKMYVIKALWETRSAGKTFMKPYYLADYMGTFLARPAWSTALEDACLFHSWDTALTNLKLVRFYVPNGQKICQIEEVSEW